MTTIAGRYELAEEIGRGGMAKVFRATDTRLDRTVAVKVLAPQFARDDAFVARFQREAQAAARLHHPNIVSVFDSGTSGDVHYIVMEYVQGRTLTEILTQDGRLLPERASEIGESVASALTAAHTAGIVHRDVKPGNIMITSHGDVKVMDFGIARMDSQQTVAQTQAVMGTASYLSPEQAQGGPVDARSDIYSLGVVLYEMLTGKPPYAGETAVSVAMQHVQGAAAPPSQSVGGIPAAYDAIVMRAMAKNPANRYQSAEELRRDLETARLGHMPVGATQVLPPAGGEPEVIEPPSRWSKWGIGLLIAAILIAFAIGAYLLGKGLLGGGNASPTPSVAAKVKVPQVVGLTLTDAEAALNQAHLVLGETKYRASDTTTPGKIISQDPPADAQVPEGTKVNIVIAKPPKPSITPTPGTASVPNVVGLTQSKAKKAITGAGFTVGTVSQQPSDTVPANQVISQDPKAGIQYQSGAAVDLVVSAGPSKVTVPDLTCMSTSKAQKTLNGLGLNMSIVLPPSPNLSCPQSNKVGSQDTPAGSQVDPGSTVNVHVSGP